ncbi:histone deacetylase complex subunit SAP30 isoform X2 [Parus major]|uniref:histone deacetylase complex subunit SAP30 isoform X2 n=1 Tax=Parus major TaxID=9157 RepID=UPI0007711331|nr:histone deacetylase complex subunit SAP30 isoform X2 [Parus major]
MNGFAPEEVTQRGAEPAAAAVVGNAGSAVEVPPPPAPPGLGPAAAAGSAGGGCAGGPGAGQLCCLREEGERCGRAAGNASFSKRIQKSISQKKVKIELDKSARHLYICDFHKNLIQSVRNRRKRKGSDDDGDSPVQDIDTPEIIGCHFRTIPVNEKDTLTYFIYSVKNDKNKPDLKMDSGVH